MSEERQPCLSSARLTRKPGVPFSTSSIDNRCDDRASRIGDGRDAVKIGMHAIGDEHFDAVQDR